MKITHEIILSQKRIDIHYFLCMFNTVLVRQGSYNEYHAFILNS